MLTPIDIEGALQTALNGLSLGTNITLAAYAAPLPPDFTTPSVYIERTGGSSHDLVMDTHMVEFDVRADRWALAQQYADSIIAKLRSLEKVGTVPVYSVELNSLPYNNFDPLNQDVPRVSFGASITTRTKE